MFHYFVKCNILYSNEYNTFTLSYINVTQLKWVGGDWN
jgi:hypothetical protein